MEHLRAKIGSGYLPLSTTDSLQFYGFAFCGEGPRSRCYGRTAALRLIVQSCDEMMRFFLLFHFNGAPVE
jgi:hypothetical protein